MPFPLNPKLSCRPVALRRSLRVLSLSFLNGALVQVAHAQTDGAQTAAPSALYSLLSTLSVCAFLALLVGAVRPKTFEFLFKEKATRGRVCGIFGAAWFFLVVLSGPLRPRPIANEAATSAAQGSGSSGKSQEAVRVAENRAKAAEARAVRAEKAAAVGNAKSKEADRKEAIGNKVKKDLGIPDSLLQSQTPPEAAPAKEPLAENVEVVDVPGIGKREAGVVDASGLKLKIPAGGFGFGQSVSIKVPTASE